tara:strand:+ start:74 stop:640 length:567 start_codon:yes stop_codon:yes gene_type:complete
MFKSSSQLLSVVLGLGLIGSNFYSLMILARKDSSMPNIAQLPYTSNSSFSFRSDKTKDSHSWSLAQNQHSPKTLLFTKDLEEEIPGFKGKKKRKSYTHKESVAYAYRPLAEEVNNGKELTAKEILCIKKAAQGETNGQMVGTLGAAKVTPAIASVPVVGPVLSALAFGQARKQAGAIGAEIASDWNDC